MYNNSQKSVEEQMKTYDANGKSVIEVYKQGKKDGKSQEDIISSMDGKIQEIKLADPGAFKHTADMSIRNVFDIGLSSIKPANKKEEFEKKLRGDSTIDKVFNENGCLHVEIVQ